MRRSRGVTNRRVEGSKKKKNEDETRRRRAEEKVVKITDEDLW